MRSADEFKTIEERKYQGGMVVELFTNSKPVHSQVKEYKDLLMWNLHTKQSLDNNTNKLGAGFQLQYMEREHDFVKNGNGFRNIIEGCESLLSEYQNNFVGKPEGEFETLDGRPVLYN